MAHVITAVGAGGKTSYLKKRARAYQRAGLRVVMTTTTHIWQEHDLTECGNLQKQDGSECRVSKEIRTSKEERLTYAGKPESSGKLSAPSREEYERICREYDVVLTEGDGSHCMPVKIPGKGEPAIPDNTDEIIVVMGRHAVGRRIETVCHRYPDGDGRFAAEEPPAPMGTPVTEALLEEIAQRYYLEPLKKQYPGAQISYYLSDMEECTDTSSAEALRGDLQYCRQDQKDDQEKPAAFPGVCAVLMASGFSRRWGGNKLLDPTWRKSEQPDPQEKYAKGSRGSYQADPENNSQKRRDDRDGNKISGWNESMYRTVLRKIRTAMASLPVRGEVVVVSQYDEILSDASASGCRAIRNEMASEGICASIRLGTEAALASDCGAVIFFAADMPFLPAEEISRFILQFLCSGKSFGCMESGKDHVMTVPGAFRLRPDGTIAGQLLALTGDRGAMRIMKQYPWDVYRYQTAEEYVRDIDRKESCQTLSPTSCER